MKKFLIVLVILIILGGLGWFFFLRGDDEPATEQEAQKQNFPVQFDASVQPTEKATYNSPFDNLSFDYPNNWITVEADGNSEAAQLLTVESPQDTNEFYFCLDFNMLSNGAEGDFTATDSDVVSSKQLESGRYAVIYTIKDLEGFYWSVTDTAVEVGATNFPNELTSDSGRLQVFGRFNCRETQKVDFSQEHFQNSQWLREAESIINTIKF